MMSRHATAIATLAAFLTLASPAAADEYDDVFNAGMQALGQAKYDKACELFAKAEDIGGADMRTRYQLGRCNQERGNHVEAHRAFADVARLAKADGDDKRAATAETRMKESAAQVGLLTITVPDGLASRRGLAVKRGADLVPPRDFGKPVAVEPGQALTVTVSADGAEPVELPVSAIAAGQSASVEVPALGNGAPPPPGAPGAPTAPSGPTKPVDDGPGKANPTLFWVGLGLTIAGPLAAAGGVYTFAVEEETAVGIAGMVGGGVMLAVGIPFMVIGGADAEPDAPKAAIHVSPGFTGLYGTF